MGGTLVSVEVETDRRYRIVGKDAMGLVRNFLDWIDELTAPKDEYGLTDKQRKEVLAHCRRGEQGRDFAEELAVLAYGMDTTKFYKLLADYGIPE